jgi:cell division protease FtsH
MSSEPPAPRSGPRPDRPGRASPPPPPPPPPPGWRTEGVPPRAGGQPPPGPPRRPVWGMRRFWLIVAGMLALSYLLSSQFVDTQPDRIRVPYTFFREQVEAGNVSEVTSRGDTIQGDFETEVTYPPTGTDGEDDADAETGTKFETERPAFADDELLELLVAQGVEVNAKPLDEPVPLWQRLLVSILPVLLIVGVFLFLMRGASRSMGGLSSIGRSKAKLYDANSQRTTFADVAGIDEAKEELAEVVDFLRNPEKYRRLGGSIPKGVLLSGPPGTGKTLLARAVAGEAGVPFFSLSASEFVEMIVGVGASRVRSLFEEAKKEAPAIIFIDELDAIGRSRSAGMSVGGHDEREQTLNQILTEMDGFTGSEGVIVLAATNRPEILDAALLRPGRFDRRVTVSSPDLTGRRAIFDVHTRKVPLADDVDLDGIAAATPGMVGADLKNLVNEAALMAARREHEKVQQNDFTDALEKIVLGAERRITLSEDERERTAYHESGHALLGMLQPGGDPVRKISIIPRGRALGVTFSAPDADRYGASASYLRGRIIQGLGGRAAEEVVYGDVTTGAEDDLQQVTRIARMMVGRWGMSDVIGPVSVVPSPGSEVFPFGNADSPSPQTQELVDQETRRILDSCYAEAVGTLRDRRDQLESLTRALLEHETLDESDAYRAAGVGRPARSAGAPKLGKGMPAGDGGNDGDRPGAVIAPGTAGGTDALLDAGAGGHRDADVGQPAPVPGPPAPPSWT